MLLVDHMNEKFPNLNIRPSLFYNWEIGIRFELGVYWNREHHYENSPYVQEVYKWAVTLFKSLHHRTMKSLAKVKYSTNMRITLRQYYDWGYY